LLGVESVSFTGLQARIITTAEHSQAEVKTVAAHAVAAAMYAGKVAVIAGFQGCTLEGEITTLGRGGSDLTAVLMAEALGAKVAEFYKDVDGMYDADPSSESAKLMREVDYSQALEIISRSKHQVIQDRALLYAQRHRVTLRVLPFSERRRIGVGTYIRDYQLSPV
jgi:aspartate kinase